MSSLCSVCANINTKKCASCKSVYYCGVKCQKHDWKNHRSQCKKLKDHRSKIRGKVVYVKAGDFSNKGKFYDLAETIVLKSYGNQIHEMKEIKTRFGWSGINGEGLHKFYSQNKEDFEWYYFMYYNDKLSEHVNIFASQCSGSEICGDVVILISGPVGFNVDECFSIEDLYNCYTFYETHDRDEVFQERECKRVLGGFPGIGIVPGTTMSYAGNPNCLISMCQ